MFDKIKQISKRIFAEEPNVEPKNESKEVPAVPHTETISIAGCKFIYKDKRNLVHTDYDFTINGKKYTEDLDAYVELEYNHNSVGFTPKVLTDRIYISSATQSEDMYKFSSV